MLHQKTDQSFPKLCLLTPKPFEGPGLDNILSEKQNVLLQHVLLQHFNAHVTSTEDQSLKNFNLKAPNHFVWTRTG